jgi:hypothetical protein
MNPEKSVSFSVEPQRRHCRYWAKLFRAGTRLPMPEVVYGAHALPGRYLQRGEEELFAGDILFEGEANHPSRDRGWTYWVHYVDDNGRLVSASSGWREFKEKLKTASGAFDPALLKGSGPLAACVRFAHVQRLGGLDTLRAMALAVEARTAMKCIAASASATIAAEAATAAATSASTGSHLSLSPSGCASV